MTTPDAPQTDPVEQYLRDAFYRNYELLRAEGYGQLTPDVREYGLNQVLLYWRKLRGLAEAVTDTEIPIQLPNQLTPEGRRFGIEGVVDLVREGGQTRMYDIKTHQADFVRANLPAYEQQLNLYAYVYTQVTNEPLDGLGVICTQFPAEVAEVRLRGRTVDELDEADTRKLNAILDGWQPLVEIPFQPEAVAGTIREFGEVVDAIERGDFAPMPPERLAERVGGPDSPIFATWVCRQCDARFSCASYRAWAEQSAGRRAPLREFERYFYGDTGDEFEQEDWVAASLNAAPDADDLDALLEN